MDAREHAILQKELQLCEQEKARAAEAAQDAYGQFMALWGFTQILTNVASSVIPHARLWNVVNAVSMGMDSTGMSSRELFEYYDEHGRIAHKCRAIEDKIRKEYGPKLPAIFPQQAPPLLLPPIGQSTQEQRDEILKLKGLSVKLRMRETGLRMKLHPGMVFAFKSPIPEERWKRVNDAYSKRLGQVMFAGAPGAQPRAASETHTEPVLPPIDLGPDEAALAAGLDVSTATNPSS